MSTTRGLAGSVCGLEVVHGRIGEHHTLGPQGNLHVNITTSVDAVMKTAIVTAVAWSPNGVCINLPWQNI